jgi:hypothetical protein
MRREPVQLELFEEPAMGRDVRRAEERALQRMYDELAVSLGLPAARVVLSARRATGGAITYGPPHVIRISSHMGAADRLQTLLHEAAHAVCHARFGPSEGHSRRFWQVAWRLGVRREAAPETDRLRAVRAANARYAYRCPGCAWEWTRKRPFGRARLCGACHRAGRPAHLILVRRPKRRQA